MIIINTNKYKSWWICRAILPLSLFSALFLFILFLILSLLKLGLKLHLQHTNLWGSGQRRCVQGKVAVLQNRCSVAEQSKGGNHVEEQPRERCRYQAGKGGQACITNAHYSALKLKLCQQGVHDREQIQWRE